MALNDSLEISSKDDEDTYRVDFPFPQAIHNEEEFITNSGRRISKYSLPQDSDAHENSHGMSESLQAQLHLSLDRLSETSYDPDEIRKKKVKNQVFHKPPFKSYPVVNETPPQAEQPKFWPNPQTTSQLVSITSPKISSGQEHDSLDQTGIMDKSEDTDNEDMRTVYVDDSLSFSGSNVLAAGNNMPSYHNEETILSDDPYSHLRYNPDWRDQNQDVVYQRQNRDVDDNSPGFPAGAITVYNEDLSPAKVHEVVKQIGPLVDTYSGHDSPVRLSADPVRLLQVNAKYEEEFNRMLQLEQRFSAVPEESLPDFSQNTPEEKQLSTESNPYQRSRLKPPTSYRKGFAAGLPVTPPLEGSKEQRSHISSTAKPKQDKVTSLSDSQLNQRQRTTQSDNKSVGSAKKAFLPTPPKAPRSNRDYVELNKARLGRKSNSASYLEMYSKKNKMSDQVKTITRRPKSDSNRKERMKNQDVQKAYEAPSMEENANSLTVEDRWTKQAEKLKIIKDGKSQVDSSSPQRRTLREVGNHSVKPQFFPEQVTASPPHNYKGNSSNEYSESSRIKQTSTNSFSENSRYSPKHGNFFSVSPRHNKTADTDFSNHPAFSPLPNKLRPRVSSYEDDMYSSENTSENNRNDYYQSPFSDSHGNRFIEPRYDQRVPDAHMPYPVGFRRGPNHQNYYDDEDFSRRYSTGDHQKYNEPHTYHHVKQQDLQSFHSSPLMQAFQQRFPHPRHLVDHSPSIPLPPEQVMMTRPHRGQEDIYHQGLGPHQKHRRQKISLPPTPPSFRKEQRHSPSFDDGRYLETAPMSSSPVQVNEANRFQAVPRLPPIRAAKMSPPLNELKNLSLKQEITPRYSLSDSETAGDSYLQRYENKKKKPSYKRYTLEDYKSLKRDVNLGGLGPDLLSVKSKMEKIDRARKYAEFVRQQHKSNTVNSPNKSNSAAEIDELKTESSLGVEQKRFTLAKESESQKKEQQDRRKRAIEYARQVPKPKTISTSALPNEDGPQQEEFDKRANEIVDWELLKALRDRHEKEKAIVAGITSPSRVK